MKKIKENNLSKKDTFAALCLAKAEKDGAYQQYCYAGQKLENCKIRERLAEVRSQPKITDEWLDRLVVSDNIKDLIRTEIKYFCRYVVTGRTDRDV